MSSVQFKAIWSIFGLIDSNLRQRLTLACIYGNGDAVVMITKDDEVYSFGIDENSYGILGLGDKVRSTLKPIKISVLSKKGVRMISIGKNGHVVASTMNGEIYTWGYGGGGQLGNGGTNNVFIPAAITANMGGHQVSRITCGFGHTLVLTSAGEVFSWGTFEYGQLGQIVSTSRPGQVTNGIDGKFVVDIACSSYSSFAVIDNGEMYSWGRNDQGQLANGTESANNRNIMPSIASSLRTIILKQVVCGTEHFLALSKTGKVYTCGLNIQGQLGNGNFTKTANALQIPEKYGSFIQVAATNYSDLSAAITDDGEIYIWGKCRFQVQNTPMKTELSSLDDVFACYSQPPVCWRPVSLVAAVPDEYRRDIITSLKNCLHDDEEIKDVTFIVENKKVKAHKTILMIRCEYFRKMFRSDWSECNKSGCILIKDIRYQAFCVFLEYIYTGIMIPTIEFDTAVDLLQVADCYQEVKLKAMCEEHLKDRITTDTCAYLFEISEKFQAEMLMTGCAKFGAHHMTAVISSKYFRSMKNSLIIQDFLLKSAQYGAFKY